MSSEISRNKFGLEEKEEKGAKIEREGKSLECGQHWFDLTSFPYQVRNIYETETKKRKKKVSNFLSVFQENLLLRKESPPTKKKKILKSIVALIGRWQEEEGGRRDCCHGWLWRRWANTTGSTGSLRSQLASLPLTLLSIWGLIFSIPFSLLSTKSGSILISFSR